MAPILFLIDAFQASWQLLVQSAPYMIFGLIVGGLLKIFLSPEYVARHLGDGRYRSVFKAALLGVPIPLCSCGVLPAASALKKQGANKGATAAFLISTPESGVDSISVTYALLDPIMTIARPVSAFLSAMTAGIGINLFLSPKAPAPALSTMVVETADCGCSNVCAGTITTQQNSSLLAKLKEMLRYAAIDIWGDLAGWFFIGLLAAGIITVLIPDETISSYLGGGVVSMLLMLCLGIPLYVCATASTPIAAAFILKGVSPGTALVFLLVGPATNITSLSVLIGILGKKASAFYLLSMAGVAILCGLLIDFLYVSLGISAAAIVSAHSEVLPQFVSLAAAIILLLLTIQPAILFIKNKILRENTGCDCGSHCGT
jgi:uncharacterized membrane protein YraQ (UPF0718 family)